MIRPCLFSILFAGLTVCLFAGEKETLLDFDSPAELSGVTANAWGGAKSRTLGYDPERRCVRLAWSNSNVTVCFRNLKRLLPGAPGFKGDPFGRYAIAYRCTRLDGVCHFDFRRGNLDWVTIAGFRRDGRSAVVVSAPTGWNREGLTLEPSEVEDVWLLLNGSGELEFYSIRAEREPKVDIPAAEYESLDTEDFRFFPEPRIFCRGKGSRPLVDRGKTEIFGDNLDWARDWLVYEIRRFYGKCIPRVTFALASTSAGREALSRAELSDDFSRVRFDGFAVKAEGDEALVVANRPGGVMFGARLLAQAVKMASGDVGPAVLPAFTVVDWPRKEHRPFHQCLRVYYHANKYEPETYMDLMERFPVDSRFNEYIFELSDFYDWKGARFPKIPMQWSRDDFAAIVRRLNANAQIVVPYVQSPGHMCDWLAMDKPLFSRIREGSKGTDVICTRNPEAWSTVTNLIDEAIAICAPDPALRSKVFSGGGDEVRWRDPHDCPLCRGTPRNELYAEYIHRLNAFVSSRGLRLKLASDMFSEAHNGMDGFKCAEVRDSLPNDIIWDHWATIDYPIIPELAQKGCGNWKLMTGYQESPEHDELVDGIGLAVFCYNWWLNRSRAGFHGGYGLLAQRLAAEAGWRDAPKKGLGMARAKRWGNFLMRNWSRKPIPRGGNGFIPLNLAAVASSPVEGTWDVGVKSLSGVPIRLVKDATGRLMGASAGNRETRIALGRSVPSLVLLHIAELAKQDEKAFFDRKVYHDLTEGPVVGMLRVEYEDGATVRIEAKYGWNVGEAVIGAGLGQQFAKFLPDARFAWDSSDGRVAYMTEWVNPMPDKPIASITLETRPTPVVYKLLAITARQR